MRWIAIATTVGIIGASAYAGRWVVATRATPVDARSFARPELRTIAATVTTTGVIRLKVGSEVRVGAQVSGIVRKLNVTIGSHIGRGDVIAEIDSSGLEARLARARAQIAVAEQEVRRTEVELARAATLYEKTLVPRQQVEDQTLARDAARAQAEKARRDAAVVGTDLSYAIIRAPISGTVASVSTQEGETVTAAFATPTFVTIIADRALELVAMVDETDIGTVARGDEASFTVEAFPTEEFQGHVERIAPKATIVSGVVNYEVEVRLESPSGVLKPDMTANVSIRTAERQALVVPSAAVKRDGDERYVFVADGDGVVKRAVTVGVREGNVTEIKKGVTSADRVLTSSPPGGKG